MTTRPSPKLSEGHDLASRLNRGLSKRNARLRFLDEVPFGASLSLRRYRLGNGLSILALRDRSAPVVSYHTWYRVGSSHEQPGKTGLAHLFEHLMFGETKNHPAGDFDRLLEGAGAEANAATWTDWTYYYENLPKRELELAVHLESDRMQHLVLRDPQVASEKEVVANERRYRVEDSVEGMADELLYARSFREHSYHWPTIGWMRDIEGFTTEDCRRFYRTYYAPNNATVIIAGDFDEATALGMVQQAYGGISSSRIPNASLKVEPPQTRERRARLEQPTATEKLLLGYKAPPLGAKDYPALIVLNEILFGGPSSRVYRSMVLEDELATSVRASVAPFRHEGLFEIWVSMRDGLSSKRGLERLDAMIADVQRDGVSEAELEKAKNRLELSFLEGMSTVGGKAEQLGFYETVMGDGAAVFAQLEAYRRLGADELKAAARTYLRRSRRTLIEVVPQTKKKRGAR